MKWFGFLGIGVGFLIMQPLSLLAMASRPKVEKTKNCQEVCVDAQTGCVTTETIGCGKDLTQCLEECQKKKKESAADEKSEAPEKEDPTEEIVEEE